MTDLEQASSECPICDDPIVVDHSSAPLVSRDYVHAIADAVEHANAHRRTVLARTTTYDTSSRRATIQTIVTNLLNDFCTPFVEYTRCGRPHMEDQSKTGIDHPEQLCEAIAGIIDELENKEIIEEDRASELRSQVYRSVETPEE
ncbi:hypothetical protein HYG81_21995 (plasmid) [Natrinema zhouii]|uniref:hypothetical protein n=1 Tax=Natrinema zhouii TaxID=1710539 RepID=UPI001CFF9517|nr:hypothetical protein [Natrinema zhouii]UHQ98647.1 hypothetical protein HYG81_21995 [Natrinema zhouii]